MTVKFVRCAKRNMTITRWTNTRTSVKSTWGPQCKSYLQFQKKQIQTLKKLSMSIFEAEGKRRINLKLGYEHLKPIHWCGVRECICFCRPILYKNLIATEKRRIMLFQSPLSEFLYKIMFRFCFNYFSLYKWIGLCFCY